MRGMAIAVFSLFHEARAFLAQDDRFCGAVPVVNEADIRVETSSGILIIEKT
jgi:hypothetical protein